MMVVDFLPTPWLHPRMDEDKSELIRQLYTRVGMVMEDGAIIALDLGSPRSDFDPMQVARIEALIASASNLLKAARALQN